jgi:putative Mn2+ efflux pump MntP
MLVKVLALVLPLGLDTFAVSTALGVGGLSARRRLRTSLLFACFEAGMPLVGLAIGHPLGAGIGSAADYLAVVVLLAVGIHMLCESETEEASELVSALDRGGVATIVLAV